MKTLEKNILIYDSDCPLCAAYSTAFIRTGMLDQNGRTAYSSLDISMKNKLDLTRSRHEIALINTTNNKVVYGVDSLLAIIGNNFPWLEKIVRFPPILFSTKRLYSFISYNRKIIAPSANMFAKDACVPDFHLTYRIAFILFASIIISSIVKQYFPLLPYFHTESFTAGTEWAITIGQLIVQGALLKFVYKKPVLDYLGNTMVVALIGALVLLPMVALSKIGLPNILYSVYFVATMIWMLWMHHQRIKLLGLPHALTATWMLYRMVLLVIIVSI